MTAIRQLHLTSFVNEVMRESSISMKGSQVFTTDICDGSAGMRQQRESIRTMQKYGGNTDMEERQT